LFKFGVVAGVVRACDVPWGNTSFDKIYCDLGVNFATAFCPAFCPTLRAMFKAVSMTCFLLINFDQKSLSFEKIPDPPT